MKFNFKIDSGFTNINYTKIASSNDYVTSERRIISCFITENKIIVCFYYSKTQINIQLYYYLLIWFK
jgi:hypothetical protein